MRSLTGGIALLLLAVVLSGCSVKDLAIRQLGKALAGSAGGAFAADEDPEFVGQAVPFSLKLIESLLFEQPENPDLLFAAASGFTQYSYVWVQQPADFIEAEDFAEAQRQRARARAFYLRAHGYAMRALESAHPGFSSAFQSDPVAAVAEVPRDEVPLLYWAAASLGGALSLGKDDPHLLVRQPQFEALLDRASALDPDWDNGALHELHGSYEPVRLGAATGGLERARRHLERAMALQQGRKVSPYVSYAENISLAQQNRAEFVAMLQRALAIDPNSDPASRLANVVMQQRARWLLDHVDDYFLSVGSPVNNNNDNDS